MPRRWTRSNPYSAPYVAIQNEETGYDYSTFGTFSNSAWEKLSGNGGDTLSYTIKSSGYTHTMQPNDVSVRNESKMTLGRTAFDQPNEYDENYSAADRIIGNDKDNTIHGHDYMRRIPGDHTIIGVSNLGTGFGWADQIFGGKGNDTIYGYAGDDLLDGGEGNDHLDGGYGNDQIAGGLGNDFVIAGLGDDIVYGGAGHDTLYGYGGNDTLKGGSGNDTINGHEGNDVIDAGTGYDVLYGGTGHDVFVFPNVAGETGVDRIKDYQVGVDMIDLNGAVIGGIGKATIWGDPYSVAINLGHMKYLIVEGVSDANDLHFVQYGDGAANRMVTTDARNNVIRSGGGNDTLSAGAGNDVLDGGAGSDTASFADVTSGSLDIDMMRVHTAGKAYDRVTDRAGFYDATVRGNTGWSDQLKNIENIIGTNGNDVIKGDANANRFEGGAGNDTLYGRGGDDVLSGGAGRNAFFGGAGADTFIINGGTDDYIYREHFNPDNYIDDFNYAEGDTLQIDRSVHNGELFYAASTDGTSLQVVEYKHGAYNIILQMNNLDANTMQNLDQWLFVDGFR